VDYDEDARWVIVHRGTLRVVANLTGAAQVVPLETSEVLLSTGRAEPDGDGDGLRLEGESAAVVRG